ncbi:hypothetical protein Pla110_07650 [Polystyrenella longa]|uniref:DUF502 domain-containing protein n=1 Tax=Polystyrenella longa TaxID=2528007 RepID=A0A518CIK9_9PLAN|nr:DUF502 domain-containing protein [Polystyrenella longa]QDU79061.1 hypothetical protein Pla110_07650 [Polystyrenella longa]
MSETDSDTSPEEPEEKKKWSIRKEPAVQFLLRGLAISLPSILTIVILIWVLNGINTYIIQPTSYAVQWSLAQFVDNSVKTDNLLMVTGQPEIDYCGDNYLWEADAAKRLNEWFHKTLPDSKNALNLRPQIYQTQLNAIFGRENWQKAIFVPVGKREWAVPYTDYQLAAQTVPLRDMPVTTSGIYALVVADQYFGGWANLTFVMVVLLVVALYFLGRLVTAQLGNWAVRKVETSILGRVPIISNVYSSVKQITDFLFTERSVEYSRVVAIEYPRKGIWSIALVTGEGMLKVTAATSEPMVSVLVPSSPMPVTGYTMMVPRSTLVDLNISIDQAFQFCISCGVLVPETQKVTPEALQREMNRRFTNTSHHITISPPPASQTTPVDSDAVPQPNLIQSGDEETPPNPEAESPQDKPADPTSPE